MTTTGGCQCGSVRYAASSILSSARCHCTACQTRTGSAFGLFVYVAKEAFHIEGEVVYFENTSARGRHVEYLSCPACGTGITQRTLPRGCEVFLSVKGGTLDETCKQDPVAEIWTASRRPWVELLPDVPAYAGPPPDFEALREAWASAKTREVYDRRASDYAKLVSRKEPDADLQRFIAGVTPGARVLDLGCGPGNTARMLADAGFEVDAIDASAEMVARASEDPRVTAWRAHFEDLDAKDRYSGIWANFSLLHAPRRALPRHIERIHRALRKGGVFHVGLKIGTGEGPDSLGRFYCYHSVSDITDLLTRTGFRIAHVREGEAKSLAGVLEPYMIVTAHA